MKTEKVMREEGPMPSQTMNSGASMASTIATNKRLASALPRNIADNGAGDMRWASRTWLRCSRVQD